MATLYGTTAAGESLPVQVNEFGQLVAQGLEGPPGPEGPPGTGGWWGEDTATGEFVPELGSDDGYGSAVIQYVHQYGLWYRWGPLVTVWVYIYAENIVATNPRGRLLISGVPPEAKMSRTIMMTAFGPSTMGYVRLGTYSLKSGLRPSLNPDGQSFLLMEDLYPATYDDYVPFAEIDKNNGTVLLSFSFQGLVDGSVTAREIHLDGWV